MGYTWLSVWLKLLWTSAWAWTANRDTWWEGGRLSEVPSSPPSAGRRLWPGVPPQEHRGLGHSALRWGYQFPLGQALNVLLYHFWHKYFNKFPLGIDEEYLAQQVKHYAGSATLVGLNPKDFAQLQFITMDKKCLINYLNVLHSHGKACCFGFHIEILKELTWKEWVWKPCDKVRPHLAVWRTGITNDTEAGLNDYNVFQGYDDVTRGLLYQAIDRHHEEQFSWWTRKLSLASLQQKR